MSIHYRISGSEIVVFGNTYPHKESIKALGARFNGSDKTWVLAHSEEKAEKVKDLCTQLGGGELGGGASSAKAVHALKKSKPSVKIEAADGLTVEQLMHRVRMSLSQAFPVPIWVIGEIQNLSKKPSAWFFSLAEPKKDAEHSSTRTVKANLWSSKLNELIKIHGPELDTLVMTEGSQVRLMVQVQLYQDRGHVTLNVVDIDLNFSKGALALAREKLLKELRAKGLDQANKKIPLSPFPFRIGLISAEGSRAESDFKDQLRSYHFPGEVLFRSAQMQGERVGEQVSSALIDLQENDCDLIVVTRGGGSAADLRWFDDRKLAYAIAESKIPIVCAIGHHDDVCIAEEVCFLRQKTPTAAADFIVHHFANTAKRIDESRMVLASRLEKTIETYQLKQESLTVRFNASVDNYYVSAKEKQMQLASRLIFAASEWISTCSHDLSRLRGDLHQLAHRSLDAEMQKGVNLANQLNQLSQRKLSLLENKWHEVAGMIKGLDPSPWLEKGWTQLIFGGEDKIRTSVEKLKKGEKAKAVFRDGTIDVIVDKIERRL